MKARTSILGTALAAVMLCAVAAPAVATHVQCGDTLTETTVLDSNLACSQLGLLIGADDVTLQLNGFTISNTAGFGTGVQAIPAEGEYNNVHVRGGGGSIVGFSPAIHMTASDSSVRKVSMSGPFGNQILITGDRTYLHRNVLEVGSGADGDGTAVNLQGDDVYTWGNTVRGIGFGIVSQGDRPRHVYNTIDGCATFGGTGISVGGYSTDAVINRNIVSGCATGISADALNEDVGGALVGLNQSSDNTSVGIDIADSFARVYRNNAHNNGDTGILTDLAGTFVRNNVANDNGNTGINGAPGTVDGGGNIATGNGDGSTPQCVNVECGAL